MDKECQRTLCMSAIRSGGTMKAVAVTGTPGTTGLLLLPLVLLASPLLLCAEAAGLTAWQVDEGLCWDP
jgi:hypothetical protein